MKRFVCHPVHRASFTELPGSYKQKSALVQKYVRPPVFPFGRDPRAEPCRIVLVKVTVYEYVTEYSLRISAGPSSDLSLFASGHEARRFRDCMSRIPWKSVSEGPLSAPQRERTEHGAKPMRFNTPGVHANLVYDFREVWLPPVQHG
jgi:hypothetical protein